VIVLGLLASTGLGLMALRGVTLLLTPESAEPFYFPLQISLPIALAGGMAVTYGLGRAMGFFGSRALRDYNARQRVREEVLERPGERVDIPEATIEY
jgi:hypothetical protein